MNNKRLPPIHPGEILIEEFLKPNCCEIPKDYPT